MNELRDKSEINEDDLNEICLLILGFHRETDDVRNVAREIYEGLNRRFLADQSLRPT